MKLFAKKISIPGLFIFLFCFASCSTQFDPVNAENSIEGLYGNYQGNYTNIFMTCTDTSATQGQDTMEIAVGSTSGSVLAVGVEFTMNQHSNGEYYSFKNNIDVAGHGSFWHIEFYDTDSVFYAYSFHGGCAESTYEFKGKKY